MAVVDNGEIIWSHQYTFEFSQMIDIGKKLVKLIVENNTSSFIGRIRGTQIWNNTRFHRETMQHNHIAFNLYVRSANFYYGFSS